MRAKVKVAVVRFALGGWMRCELGDWLAHTLHKISLDARVEGFFSFWLSEMPLYAARNKAVRVADRQGADYLLMLDNDMHPDCLPGAPPFWETAFSLALAHDGPCVVAAPACTKEGEVCVHEEKLDLESGAKRLLRIPREKAARRSGIERVPACGPSVMLIDMRCFDHLRHPYFRCTYTDEACAQMAADEGVLFTADLQGPGIPTYVAWDCWSNHLKTAAIGKPEAEEG